MDSSSWERIREVYHSALPLSRSDRVAFLDSACDQDLALRAEIESLLSCADRAGDFLEPPSAFFAPFFRAPWPTHALLGTRIGAYTIRGVLGAGGMGVVYEAEQDQPRRRVALKIVPPRPGMSRLASRFRREANALGRLQHPGIAQIIEAGADQTGPVPRPYFAMELVRGEPITRFAAARDLSIEERVTLMARVCDAVEHAHQKGVIHRDLKPANILVTADGQPKVLDFGIAHLTDADVEPATLATGADQLLGTVRYMSPEQVAGDAGRLDTRSDVYALGIICYELLTGSLPYDLISKPIPEALRIIAQDAPTSPSARNRQLRGDLETIVLKAIEKEPEHRYASAAALGEDLTRYLNDQPILAYPPSTAYQLRKIILRHKAVSAAAALLLLVAATSGVTLACLYRQSQMRLGETRTAQVQTERALKLAGEEAIRASRSEADAKRQARAAAAARDFMADVFRSMSPNRTKVPRASIDSLLETAGERVAGDAQMEPLAKGAVLFQIGEIYHSWSKWDRARALLEEALEIQRRELPPLHRNIQMTLRRLASAALNLRDLEAAEGYIDEVLRTAAASPAPPEHLGGDFQVKARILRDRRDYANAEVYFERALAQQRAEFGENSPELARVLHPYGNLKCWTGRFDEAQQLLDQALSLVRPRLGDDHTDVLQIRRDLGILLHRRGRTEQAEIVLRNVWERYRAKFGPGSRPAFLVARSYAAVLKDCGKSEQAERILREALQVADEPAP